MAEYRFDHAPAVGRGRVIEEVRNSGFLDHQLVLVSLPADFPAFDAPRESTPRAVPTVAILPARPPGSRGIFAADLAPGRYAFYCYLPAADGGQHADKGMRSELRVL